MAIEHPITIDDRGIWEEIYSKEEISARVKELAEEISQDYKGKKLLLVGILKGAFLFTGDLMRELNESLPDVEVDFMAVTSYGEGEESNRAPKILLDVNKNIEGMDVLVVEDIVDTGYSFEKLLGLLSARKPNTLKTCAFLSKPSRREVEVPIDYLGFAIPDRWIEGYGPDSGEKGRGRKNIVAKVTKPQS